MQSTRELVSEQRQSWTETGEIERTDSDLPRATKLYSRNGETLDRRLVFISSPVTSDAKTATIQHLFVFSTPPQWQGWTLLQSDSVDFRMATRVEAKAKFRDLARWEREGFEASPDRGRWLGIVSSDGCFRLLMTFSKKHLAGCREYALSCLNACTNGNPCRSLLQSFADALGRFCGMDATKMEDSRSAALPAQSAHSHAAVSSKAGRTAINRKLSRWSVNQLKNFAEKNGFGLETLFAASWAHLIAAYSGSTTAPMWRQRVRVTGSATNQSLMRVLVPAGSDESVYEWLRSVAVALAGRSDSGATELPVGEWTADSILLFTHSQEEPMLRLLQDSNCGVLLHVCDGETFSLSLSYENGRFSDEFAQTLLTCLETIAVQLPHAHLEAVHTLDLIPAALRSQYLAPPAGASVDAAGFNRLVHTLIEKQAQREPARVAGIENGASISYADLDRRANQLAHRLQRLGAGPDQVVAVRLKRSIDLLVSIVAILKSGAAYLPLDVSLPVGRVETVLQESEAPILITSQALAERFSTISSHLLSIDVERESLNAESAAAVQSPVEPSNLVYVTYTSGSTGKPKGVMVEHRNLVASFAGMEQMFGSAASVWLAAANISFDISITELVWTLTKGSTIVFHEGDEGKPVISGARSIPQQIIEHRVTHFQATPALAQMLSGHPAGALKNLQRMSVGGESFPPGLAAELLKTMPGQVVNAYGPTETTVCATFHPVRKVNGVVPIGKSMVNARLYVLDKWGRLVPPLAPGELYIGGPIVTRGYHRRPDLTAERFLPNPFASDPEERVYRTGDLVRFNTNGDLEFVARTDAQVKLHGYRIELGEIEATLNSHPAIQHAVVVLQEKGESHRLVGYFQALSGSKPTLSELQQYLRRVLPEYMVPSVFVPVEQFPMNGSGKVDRARLPEPDALALRDLQAGAADDAGLETPTDAATQEIEADLCAWCRELLNAPSVSGLDDFFEIGGHSLVAAEIVIRVAKKYDAHMRLSAFNRVRKLRAIARLIQQERTGAVSTSHRSPVVTIRSTGSKAPIFLLAGIGGSIVNFELLSKSLDPERPIYAIETHGLDGDNAVLTRIEDMAATYLREVQKIQPTGPYHLIGYSFGGVIAYEMARQLKSLSMDAGVIGLIDTSEYSYQQQVIAGLRPAQKWQSVYKDRFRRLLFGPHRFDAFAERMRIKLVKSRFALSTKFGRPLPATVGKSEDRNFYALNQYDPQPYGDPIHLFRCMETDRFDGPDPLLGWGRLASQIVVHRVPGQHGDVIREPYVHQLGAVLDGCVDSVEAGIAAQGSAAAADPAEIGLQLPRSA